MSAAIWVQAGTTGGSTTFTLSGSGELITNNTLQGDTVADQAGGTQVFNFPGGTLVANADQRHQSFRHCRPGRAWHALQHGRHSRAPGGIGIAGLTTITGSYVHSAVPLAINIGGAK